MRDEDIRSFVFAVPGVSLPYFSLRGEHWQSRRTIVKGSNQVFVVGCDRPVPLTDDARIERIIVGEAVDVDCHGV